MAYRIYQFDGLTITDITKLHEGGSNDIGSGDALTSFAQLPGRGFFDNYGAGDSPQGIRPITRNCVLWGDTEAELITNLKAIRGKIGRRGRLTVQFDDGSLWRQWARLQKVHTPRPQEAKGNFLPCNLTWVSAAQMWYGIVQSGDTWSVGDDSFYLGDGAVSLGMNDYTYALAPGTDTLTATLPNNGNTFVRNMSITLQTDSLCNSLTLHESNRGQTLIWTNPALTGAFTLTIDTGSKSCHVRMDSEGVAIGTIQIRGASILVSTGAVHGLATGDSAEITGTTLYDGVYHDITVINTSLFSASLPSLFPDDAYELLTIGTVYPLVD